MVTTASWGLGLPWDVGLAKQMHQGLTGLLLGDAVGYRSFQSAHSGDGQLIAGAVDCSRRGEVAAAVQLQVGEAHETLL